MRLLSAFQQNIYPISNGGASLCYIALGAAIEDSQGTSKNTSLLRADAADGGGQRPVLLLQVQEPLICENHSDAGFDVPLRPVTTSVSLSQNLRIATVSCPNAIRVLSKK